VRSRVVAQSQQVNNLRQGAGAKGSLRRKRNFPPRPHLGAPMPEPQTIDWNANARVIVDAAKVSIRRRDESGAWLDVPADSFLLFWITEKQ
jgi:hypothetical protein